MEKLETLLALEPEEIITKYEQEVGYFRGMNKVVAVLLMFLNEDDTFWRLFQLMTDEEHAMRNAPFPLTLRLWEASILEGGHLLTAMAYTVLKVHRRKRA
ncbi:hypothetical protein E5288_WYG002628 [Bos mutus]|uniref:Rab-GAP TBC domain-containing protein n=1 Tax=Bos mutus TaxID=72004 RepID=A0A6B0R512_9CETA|nr:hypothetical protein [Bos mutus]